MMATTFNLQNPRGESLLFRCLETGFVTTVPALTRYQQGRGIDLSRRELVEKRREQWCRRRHVTICEHCSQVIQGNPRTVRQHQQSKRCLTASGHSAGRCAAAQNNGSWRISQRGEEQAITSEARYTRVRPDPYRGGTPCRREIENPKPIRAGVDESSTRQT